MNHITKETAQIKLSPEKKRIVEDVSSGKENPRMIIQRAYDELELTLKETLATNMGINYTHSFELDNALKKVLPENKYTLFRKMKELRDIVAHEPIIVTSGTSTDYTASSLRLADDLQSLVTPPPTTEPPIENE